MTDSNEPTPWEEINPPMALAPQRGLPSQSSDRLAPATSAVFRNELTACLTLVAPAGMTEEARRDWFVVAWATLKHLPPDILAIGCKKARETCDHPSKVVPTILAETKEMLGWRRGSARPSAEPLQLPRPDYCTPEEATAILKQYGLRTSV
jgi:hypothetical protein